MKINVNFKILLLLGTFLISSIIWNPVLAQIPPGTGLSVNINTPFDSANVPSGDLTIYGTSSDDDTKNCQVYADWNDLKPMQNVIPNGPKGNADYSKWSYTYTGSYHHIVEGSNELTSKITCFDQGQNASSKFYSINVTGTEDGSEITKDNVKQSSEHTNPHNEATDVLPVKNTNNSSTDPSVQQSSEDTNKNNEASNLSVKNTDSTGKYKILPLYSESSEKAANSASSEEADKKEVTSTDTSKSQDSPNPVKIDNTDTKTLSSEQPQQPEVTSADTSESQDSPNPLKMDNTHMKSLSSEQPQQPELTSADTSESQDSPNPLKMDNTDMKTLSSEQPQQPEVTSADTSESQDSPNPLKMDNTDMKTLSSEQQQQSGETTAYDTSQPKVTDSTNEKPSTDTNKYFTFEPNLQGDEKISVNDNNPDSDSSIPNHYDDGNSVFGLRMKSLGEDTKNQLDNNIQKLEERLPDHTHMFGIVK
jgi:hypothetical protein